jgi:trehalose 6-phosphate phosphatase
VSTRNILAARHSERLRAAAAGGALLAFDFDGTLAPFNGDPFTTRMRDATSELLRSLAHCAPVAVITGRSVADVTPRLEAIPVLAIIGNHGAEPSPQAERAANEVAEWAPLLVHALRRFPGVVIENKRLSVSVHYRDAVSHRRVRNRVAEVVARITTPVMAIDGTLLVNVIPAGLPNKGDAVSALLHQHNLPHAVFVGDELTDEDAFITVASGNGLAVRVGRSSRTAAIYHVETQADVDAMLAELLIGRTRPVHSGSREVRMGG